MNYEETKGIPVKASGRYGFELKKGEDGEERAINYLTSSANPQDRTYLTGDIVWAWAGKTNEKPRFGQEVTVEGRLIAGMINVESAEFRRETIHVECMLTAEEARSSLYALMNMLPKLPSPLIMALESAMEPHDEKECPQ